MESTESNKKEGRHVLKGKMRYMHHVVDEREIYNSTCKKTERSENIVFLKHYSYRRSSIVWEYLFNI